MKTNDTYKSTAKELQYDPKKEFSGCWFCYPREQGTHGEIKREPSADWGMIQVCREHAPRRN